MTRLRLRRLFEFRVRCGRIHEEEKRSTSYKSSRETGGRDEKTNFMPRKFMKKKPHHTHVAEEAHEEDQEEGGEEAENEEEGLSPVEEELEEDAMESDEDDEAEEIEDDELKEAFAAGWKENKQKTAFARKNRGWKQTDNKENKGIDGQKSLDARKKVTGYHMQLMWKAWTLAWR
jgi:hypothetical protein